VTPGSQSPTLNVIEGYMIPLPQAGAHTAWSRVSSLDDSTASHSGPFARTRAGVHLIEVLRSPFLCRFRLLDTGRTTPKDVHDRAFPAAANVHDYLHEQSCQCLRGMQEAGK